MSSPASPIVITEMRNGKWRVECHACGWWVDKPDIRVASGERATHARGCHVSARSARRGTR